MNGKGPLHIRCLVLIAGLAACTLQTGCGGSTAREEPRRYFVDVTSGKLITAHTVGREPIIIRDPSAIAEPPDLPRRETLAAVRHPESSSPIDLTAEGDDAATPAGADAPATADADEGGAAAGATGRAPLPDFDPAELDRAARESNAGPRVVWTILLKSITDENHRTLAATAARVFASNAPGLRNGIWTHTTDKGSMVLYGRYDSLDDQTAQSDLQWVKSIEVQGQNPYIASHMARITLGDRGSQTLHPFDLRTLRKKHPEVDPLYTLEVAAWMADANDARSWARCRAAAEAYTRQLRAQGYQAWFYHNDLTEISSVTVGGFDRTAMNDKSGFYAADLKKLADQFPQKLVNGQPFTDPKTGKPQKPHLSEVPE